MKPITQKHNKFDYPTFLVTALITAVIGIVYNQPVFYLVTVVLIGLALFSVFAVSVENSGVYAITNKIIRGLYKFF